MSDSIIDRHGWLERLNNRPPGVRLELGCGPRKRDADAIGIDALPFDGVDIVGDVFEVLGRMPSASIEAVSSSHFFEHIAHLPRLLRELERVMRPGATLRTVVPHFSNPYFYSDYTHQRTFGLYSFSYLCRDTILRRQVPQYGEAVGFDLVSVRLRFKAPRPFYVRHAARQVIDLIVNSTSWTQEWYEAGWCWLFPCYEIEYNLRRSDAETQTARPTDS